MDAHDVPLAPPGTITYGPSRAFTRGTWISAVTLCGFCVTLVATLLVQIVNESGPAAPDASGRLVSALIALFTAALAVGYWFLVIKVLLRPRLIAGRNGLTVINYASRRDIAWDEIDGFDLGSDGGYRGIRIRLRGQGGDVLANAVQTWRLATWMGRRTRADRVVEELTERLRLADASAPRWAVRRTCPLDDT